MKGRNETRRTMAMAMVYLTVFFSLNVAWAGGGSSSLSSTHFTRLIVEQQLRQQVVQVAVSIWNSENDYSASSSVGPDGWVELKIDNPRPGAYLMFVSEQIIKNGQIYSVFEHRSEIVIKDGENTFSPKLTLVRFLPVTFTLPEDWVLQNEFNIQAILTDGSVSDQGPSWSTIEDQRKTLIAFVPIDAAQVTIDFGGKRYTADASFLLGGMATDEPMPLIAFPSRDLPKLTINASLRENYLIAGVDYGTIQATINAANSGQTVMIKQGSYNERITLKAGVPVIGDTACPQCVIIGSDEAQTVTADGPGDYSISGVMIRNGYSGQKYWSTAAVMTDRGAHVEMDHCIVEATGTADPIANNYSALRFTNLTIKGSGSGVVGINLYNNNGPTDVFKNLLFYNLGSAMRQTNTSVPIVVTNSLFWQASIENIKQDPSNTFGDPQFNWDYPNLNAPDVQAIMAIDGNYPGALRPTPRH